MTAGLLGFIGAAVMIYAVIRFRVREDDEEDGPPIHGNTGLEITWTAIPFVLVTAIAIVSAIVLSRNDAQAQDTLRVNVVAQQLSSRSATRTRTTRRVPCCASRKGAPSSSTCARST